MATADNLKIAQQLLATMTQITAQVERQTEAYHAQAQLVDALCKAQECFGKIDADKVREVTNALKEAQEKTKEFGTEIETATKNTGFLGEAIQKVADHLQKISVPAEFLNGIKGGLSMSNNMFSVLMSLGKDLLGLLADIGMSILSFPGKLLEFFQDAYQGGIDPYIQALEKLRGEFGNLEIGTSKAVKSMTEDMKNFERTGLSVGRVFGYGREGLAKILETFQELAKGMGPIFRDFANSAKGAEVEVLALAKGMHLGADSFKNMQIAANNGGKTVRQRMNEMIMMTAKAERTFGIAGAEIGKDIEALSKDTGTFGIMAPDVMLKTSIYVKKLGISVETLKKVMDKSLNFEDAASQAGKLAEAFNMNIDAMKLMKAQTPAEKLDILREGFFRTGQNIENMSIAQRKLLGDTVGLTDEELRLALSQKNRAMTGKSLDAQFKKSQKQQLTQAEALKQVAKSIERLVQAGQGMKGSFFNVFMDGFFKGIRRTKEFREVVYNLQRSMKTVYFAGRDIGRMFVKEFPGIKNILKGLADMFNPARFRELMGKVKAEFSIFFKMLQTDPKAGVQHFMKRMKEIFFDFFTKGAPAGSRFLDGLKQFWKAVFIILVEGIKYGLTAIRDALKTIIEVIKNPSAISNLTGGLSGDIVDSFSNMFTYLKAELGPIFMEGAGLLWDLLVLMFHKLNDKYIKPNLKYIALAYFAPAIVGGVVRGGMAALMSGVGVLISRFASGTQTIAEGVTKTVKTTGADGTVTEETVSRQAAKTEAIGTQLLRLAGSLAIFIAAVSLSVYAIIQLAALYQKLNVKMESFLLVAAMFAGVTLVLGVLIKSNVLQGLTGLPSLAEAGKGLVSLGAVILAIGAAVLAMIGLSKMVGRDPSSLLAVASVMETVTKLFFAAAPLLAIATGIGAAGAALSIATLGGAVASAVAGMASLGAILVSVAATSVKIIKEFTNVNPATAQVAMTVMDKITTLYRVVGGMLDSVLQFARESQRAGEAEKIVKSLTGFIHKVGESAISIIDRVRTSGNIEEMKAKAEILNSALGGMGSIISPLANFAKAYSQNSGYLNPAVFDSFGKSVGTIVDKLSNAITSIMSSLRTLISGVTNVNVIKEAAAAIAGIMQAIGALFTIVMQLFPSQSGARTATTLGGMAAGATIGATIGSAIPGIGTIIGGAVGAIIGAGIAYFSQSGEFSQRIDAVKDSFKLIVDNMGTLVSAITTNLRPLLTMENVNASSLQMAQAISSILTAVAQLFSSMFSSAQAISGIRDMTPEKIESILGKFTAIISGGMAQVQTAMLAIGTSINSVVSLVTNTKTSSSQLKAMDNIVTIMNAVGSLITTMTSAALGIMSKASGTPEQMVRFLQVTTSWFSRIMQDLPNALTTIMSKVPDLIRTVSGINVPRGISQKIGVIRSLFDMVGAVTRVVSDITSSTHSGGQNVWIWTGSASIRASEANSHQAVESAASSIRTLLGMLQDPVGNGGRTIPQLIQNLINAISSFNFGRSGMSAFTSKMSAITSLFTSLGTISTSVKNITDNLKAEGSNTTVITADAITKPLESLANILTGITQPSIGTVASYPNPLYNTALLTRAIRLNSNLGDLHLATSLTSLKNKLVEIFDAVRSFPTNENLDATLGTKIESALTILSQVLIKLTVAAATNPLYDIDKETTNPLRKAATLGNNLRSLNISRSLGNLQTQLSSVFSIFSTIGDNFGRLNMPDLQAIDNAFVKNFGNDSVISRLSLYLGDSSAAYIANRVTTITDNLKGRLTSDLRAMVTALNAFNRDLANLNAPLEVTLQKYADGLGAHQTARVENSAVNATINVNIKLEAGQLSQALWDFSSTQTNAQTVRRHIKRSSFIDKATD